VSVATFSALNLDELFATRESRNGRVYAPVRRELDIQAFGTYAVRAEDAGAELMADHDETGPGADRHEELFFVASGRATFTVGGEAIDAPAGTYVFVRDPETRRAAVAEEPGTTMLVISGRPGEAWRMTPGEALNEFFPLHEAKDFEGAAAVAREVLQDYPGNGLALYNLACCESLLGRADDATEHLRDALKAAPSLVQNAKTDEDFVGIRDDPRFKVLIAD
jgi:mannose-6-phosphate isomerase-like protein (cupin superfamily)